jgi:hypothetical protein
MATTTADTTQTRNIHATDTPRPVAVAEASKLAAAVAEVRILAVRFRREGGHDEMFLTDLERLVDAWEQTAAAEYIGYMNLPENLPAS